jgi:citrate synthase
VAETIDTGALIKRPSYPTALGASSLTTITLLGQDLARDVMGTVGFGELAFWLATQRKPTPGETRVFEAVLAALADHGFTPTAIATRLTYLSAPDSIQGALAAGLLGGGSRFLGVTEDCGRFLHTILIDACRDGALPDNDDGWDALALDTVQAQRAARRFIPGLGHHVHKQGDPRTPRLFRIAAEEELFGPHLSLFAAIGRVHPQVLSKTLPLSRRLRRSTRRPGPAPGAAARVRPARPHRRLDRTARRRDPPPGRQRRVPRGGPEQRLRRSRPVPARPAY